MADLPEYHTVLRSAVDDALRALERSKPLVAEMLLRKGRFREEELIRWEEERRSSAEPPPEPEESTEEP